MLGAVKSGKRTNESRASESAGSRAKKASPWDFLISDELKQKYPEQEIREELRRTRKTLLLVYVVMVPSIYLMMVPMFHFGFRESWLFSFMFTTFMNILGIPALFILVYKTRYVEMLVEVRLRDRHQIHRFWEKPRFRK
jgi:cation transport ATPase